MADEVESEALREAMTVLGDPHRSAALYDDLAPVWDFVIARRYDYDALADFVTDRAPADAGSVAVLACGPGRLLARLADRYDEVIGIDRSARMCELARGRTDATVVKSDLLEYDPPTRVDVATLLGNTIIHVSPTQLEAVFETIHAMLAPGGVFLCDFTRADTLRNGHVTDDRFDSEEFRVERTMVTTVEDRDRAGPGIPARYTYSFEITDKPEHGGVTITIDDETDRTAVRTGTSMAVRLYEFSELARMARTAGLTEVSSVPVPTPHEGGLLGSRIG